MTTQILISTETHIIPITVTDNNIIWEYYEDALNQKLTLIESTENPDSVLLPISTALLQFTDLDVKVTILSDDNTLLSTTIQRLSTVVHEEPYCQEDSIILILINNT